ncbi:hypothetical protein, partial [Brevibacillus agri]
NPLSLNRYTYVSNNPLKFVDPSGHIQEMTGGVGGFSSPAEEYMHWAKVAARRAYEEGIEPEDAVRKYVPTQYQREVLSTAIVTFNNTVGMNHGDAPDLGLGVAGAGAAVGTIRNTGNLAAKIEANAMAQLRKMEQASGAHFFSRHGAQTTLAQQYNRAITGLTPDGIAGRMVDSSRFLTHLKQLNAVQRAETIFRQTGKTVFDFDMGEIIGEGYLRGGGNVINTTKVQAVFKDGKLVTLYPKLR